jgi:hypothetical protein
MGCGGWEVQGHGARIQQRPLCCVIPEEKAEGQVSLKTEKGSHPFYQEATPGMS